MASLNSLTDEDLYDTVAKLITGDSDVDGVVIDDVEHDDSGIDLILADDDGHQRRLTLTVSG
jgi:hypothetical protein